MSLKIFPKEIWISQITGRMCSERMTSSFWAHFKLVKQTPLSPEQRRAKLQPKGKTPSCKKSKTRSHG